MSTGTLVLEALVVETLLRNFEELPFDDCSLERFKAVWKANKFGQIHHVIEMCVPQNLKDHQVYEMRRVLIRKLFQALEIILVKSGLLARKLGAVFCMYVAFRTQTLEPPEKISLSKFGVSALLRICKSVERDESLGVGISDLHFVVRQILDQGFCRFVISPDFNSHLQSILLKEQTSLSPKLLGYLERLIAKLKVCREELVATTSDLFAMGSDETHEKAARLVQEAESILSVINKPEKLGDILSTAVSIEDDKPSIEGPISSSSGTTTTLAKEEVPRNPLSLYQRWKSAHGSFDTYKTLDRNVPANLPSHNLETRKKAATQPSSSVGKFPVTKSNRVSLRESSDEDSDDSSSDGSSEEESGFNTFRANLQTLLSSNSQNEQSAAQGQKKSTSSAPKKKPQTESRELSDPNILLDSLKSVLDGIKEMQKASRAKKPKPPTSKRKDGESGKRNEKQIDSADVALLKDLSMGLPRGTKRKRTSKSSSSKKKVTNAKTSEQSESGPTQSDRDLLESLESFLNSTT